MIRAVIDYHKKLFIRNPVIITVMVLYSVNYLVDRYISFYSEHAFFTDFAVEIVFYYGLSFYGIPVLFRGKKRTTEEDARFGNDDYLRRSEDDMSFSNYDSMSSCDRHNPNRYDVNSPLYVSSLGKPI